jgi:LPXTG-site transpeptidase (sortase) family protein
MIKKILLFILIIVAAYALLNIPYLWKQVKFQVSKPTAAVTTNSSPESKKMAPNQLSIASLNITAPLIEPSASNEDAYQLALQNGVVHYPGTAAVGQPGNAYFFGHSSDFAFSKGAYKTVFALLPSIKIGAEILISNSAGDQFKYIVTEGKVVSNNDLSVLDQKENKEKLLSLQTSYPVGTALKRYIVVSKLAE